MSYPTEKERAKEEVEENAAELEDEARQKLQEAVERGEMSQEEANAKMNLLDEIVTEEVEEIEKAIDES